MEWPISWNDVKTELERSKLVKINLYDWGIDLFGMLAEAMSSQKTVVGKVVNVDYNFWDAVTEAGNNLLLVPGGDHDTVGFKPTVIDVSDTSRKQFLGFNVGVLFDGVSYINASVYMNATNDVYKTMIVMNVSVSTPDLI